MEEGLLIASLELNLHNPIRKPPPYPLRGYLLN